ncbi:nucleoside deaminase [Bacillus massiliglaciei]|uniref:nucleoside deaminase n=1 Tax=Bacillus massiliglaciei TaxID=1816693 RepID=UPI000B19512C|nr:nucleoside deaminase [Bacillus massiliglaciei]
MDIRFMKRAIELAYHNVMSKGGGPFGAVVVKEGKIIAEGCNHVTTMMDPTAHAEVQAIRNACKELGSFQLTDCDIYTSCEPCPMCIGAIYWARPRAVYYASTKEEAAQIGFDDHFIYTELAIPMENRALPMMKIQPPDHSLPFTAWEKLVEKAEY